MMTQSLKTLLSVAEAILPQECRLVGKLHSHVGIKSQKLIEISLIIMEGLSYLTLRNKVRKIIFLLSALAYYMGTGFIPNREMGMVSEIPKTIRCYNEHIIRMVGS